MPVRTPPTLAHPTLQTTLTGVLGEGDVIQYLGIPYGTVSKRWTFASRRDDIGRRFDATLQGCARFVQLKLT